MPGSSARAASGSRSRRRRLSSSASRSGSCRNRAAEAGTAIRSNATRRSCSRTCSRASSRSSAPSRSTASSCALWKGRKRTSWTRRRRVPAAAAETLPEALAYWGRLQPARLALGDGNEELTYGELDRLVGEAAGRLARTGVRPSDRVALLGTNSVDWVVAFLAGLHLGAIVVPLNARLSPLELRRQLEIADP